MPKSIDIGNVASPDQLVAALRKAAQAYGESAVDLAHDWQDASAGSIWAYAADQLERAALRIEHKWSAV